MTVLPVVTFAVIAVLLRFAGRDFALIIGGTALSAALLLLTLT
jgi:hypothetical protein